MLVPPARLGVLDTSILTTDIISAINRRGPTSLTAAMRHHTYRGFISHRVWAEVPRVLEDRAQEGEVFDLHRATDGDRPAARRAHGRGAGTVPSLDDRPAVPRLGLPVRLHLGSEACLSRPALPAIRRIVRFHAWGRSFDFPAPTAAVV